MAHEQLHRQKVPSPLSFHLLHSLIFLRLYLHEQERVAVEISGEGQRYYGDLVTLSLEQVGSTFIGPLTVCYVGLQAEVFARSSELLCP